MGADVFFLKEPPSPIKIVQNTVVSQKVGQSDQGPPDMIGDPFTLLSWICIICFYVIFNIE